MVSAKGLYTFGLAAGLVVGGVEVCGCIPGTIRLLVR